MASFDPSLNSVIITTSNANSEFAKEGDIITLSIDSNEDIDPTVTFSIGANDIDESRVSYSPVDVSFNDSWEVSFSVESGDNEGNIKYSIEFIDVSNNSGTTVSETSNIVVDTTDPTFISASASTNNTIGGNVAIPGDTITFTFEFDTEIDTPTVSFDSNDTAIESSSRQITISSDDQKTWTAAYVVHDDDDDGSSITYTIQYSDLAGNDGVDKEDTISNITIDTEKPTLSPVSIISNNTTDTAYATLENTITLSFTASEEINTPTVSFHHSGNTVDNSVVSYDSSDNTIWEITYEINSSDAQQGGLVTFTIEFSNIYGLSGDSVSTTTDDSTMTVDIWNPYIQSTNIYTDNSNNTSIATENDSIILTFEIVDETDVSTPDVSFNINGTYYDADSVDVCSNVVDTSSNEHTASIYTYTATYTIESSINDGDVSYIIGDYTDAAGNVGTGITQYGTGVYVDKVEPELNSVNLTSNNTATSSTLVKADDIVTLNIVANEDIQTPTVIFKSGGEKVIDSVTDSVTVSSATNSQTIWYASYTVNSDDEDGVITYTIDYEDLAGVSGTTVSDGTGNLEVDNDAPTLYDVSITSDNSDTSLAKEDDIVTVSFYADKEINTPTVTFYSGSSSVTNTSTTYTLIDSSYNQWSAAYTVNSQDTNGAVTFTIDYSDYAGNSGTQVTEADIDDATSVTIDTVSPTFTQSSILSDNSYDTSKGTTDNTITLTFTASEEISEPTIVFKFGGDSISNSSITYKNTNTDTYEWTASYVVSDLDTSGTVTYSYSISDLAGNNTTVHNVTTTITIDNILPTITKLSTTTKEGSYNADNTITIGVTFSKTISVTTTSSGEYPYINLNSGANATAIYDSTLDDSTNNIIYFNYDVNDGDTISILDAESLSPFDITNTTIIDYIGNEADLTLTNSNFTNSLYSTGIEIDTTAPNGPTNWTITSTRSGSDDYFQYASEGDIVTVSLTFDESVTISSASFTSNNISVTNDAYGSNWSTSSTTHTVSYEVDSSDDEGVVDFSITYADEANNTTTIDKSAGNQTNDSTTTFLTINIDLTAATLRETSFASTSGKTVLTAGDTIRLEFSSTESVAYSAYGTGEPTVVFYGLNSDNEHIDTVYATQVTDDNSVDNDTTWAYEGTVPDDAAIVEMAYKVTEAYDKAGNLSTLEDTNDFIEVDEVPPSIDSTSIISNNSNNTEYAKSGDIVTLTINPSETINQPTVYFKVTNTATANNSITTSTVYSEQSNSNTWTATYTINDTYDGDGDLYYTIASYTDLADNSGDSFNQDSDGATSTVINVLTSTPTLSDVSILSYNENTSLYAKSGDTVTVYFTGARTLNSATVTFLSDSESITATTSSYSTYDWEASYTVSGSDSDGDITFTINFEDLAGNPGSTSSTTDDTSVSIDNTAPTINAITTDAFSWGTYLNIDESSSDATVDVTTSGVEDNQTLTLTLNETTYTATVTSNACTVTITSTGMQDLTDDTIYYISADVTDLVGNAATTVNSSFFTVDYTGPTIVNIKGISEANSYKADDIITIALRFSETVYVTGSPSLNLNSDSNATATYDSGSESTILLFKYTVSSGDSTISNNTIGYLDVDSINYDSTNYIEDVANNKVGQTQTVDENYAIPFNSGTENSLSYNTEIVIDTTAPSDFDVGTVEAKGGIYDAGYYNSSNTSVNIHVPIDDDVSLIDGTIRLIFSTNNENTYDTSSFSSYDYTIVTGNLGNVYTFSVNEVDFESNIDESAEIHFSAIITDKAGNQTTGSASSDTIIRDDIPPHPVTVGTITADGGRVAQNYYNSTNDGLTISVPINNNPLLVRPDNATTLIAGTVQVLVSVDNGVSYNEIGDLVEIETADLLTNKEIVLSDQDFIGAVAEGETALFNVTITDQADNITSSSPAPPDVTVSPAPDYTTYDPYANSPSNGFIRQETLPPVPNVIFTNGSTKSNYNNRINVRLGNTIVKWDYTTNFGANYTTIYNNNGTFISLAAGVYLPGSIIIRNYDIADNRSLVSNTNKIIISSSRQGFPLANQSSSTAMNKMKGFAFSRGASR